MVRVRGMLTVGLVAAFLSLAPSVAAQPGEPAPETLVLVTQAPADAQPPSDAVCGELERYGLGEPHEAATEREKAYTSTSTWAVGCPTLFWGQAPGGFNLTGDVSAWVLIGCDSTTVLHEPLDNVVANLVRNGGSISTASASAGATCSPGDPIEIELTFERPDDSRFNATDALGLNVTVFGSPNAARDNLHFLVGGQQPASTLQLPGLAEAFEEKVDTGGQDAKLEEANDSEPLGQTADAQPGAENGLPGPGATVVMFVVALMASARHEHR